MASELPLRHSLLPLLRRRCKCSLTHRRNPDEVQAAPHHFAVRSAASSAALTDGFLPFFSVSVGGWQMSSRYSDVFHSTLTHTQTDVAQRTLGVVAASQLSFAASQRNLPSVPLSLLPTVPTFFTQSLPFSPPPRYPLPPSFQDGIVVNDTMFKRLYVVPPAAGFPFLLFLLVFTTRCCWPLQIQWRRVHSKPDPLHPRRGRHPPAEVLYSPLQHLPHPVGFVDHFLPAVEQRQHSLPPGV